MKKILRLEELKKILSFNQRIVLVTGCFDILHQAHKDFLKEAKKKGEILIVGLESDIRIRKLKGKERPVNCWKKRAAALAKLKVVDFVFPLPKKFEKTSDHLNLLRIIKPSILAVSENTPFLEKKRKLIKMVGGNLYIFPHNPRFSTTNLLTKK